MCLHNPETEKTISLLFVIASYTLSFIKQTGIHFSSVCLLHRSLVIDIIVHAHASAPPTGILIHTLNSIIIAPSCTVTVKISVLVCTSN